jgi:hypothetical protein
MDERKREGKVVLSVAVQRSAVSSERWLVSSVGQ